MVTPAGAFVCNDTLSATNPTFTRPNEGNPPTTTLQASTYYRTFTFTPTESKQYAITISNALEARDDVNGNLSQITRTLTAGTTYILVSTSYGTGATGTFTNTITPNTITGSGSAATATPTPSVTPNPARPDTIGVYNNGSWSLRTSNTFAFGAPNSKPVAGKWILPSQPVVSGIIQPISGNPVNGNEGSAD
jgi:hypothetical protein